MNEAIVIITSNWGGGVTPLETFLLLLCFSFVGDSPNHEDGEYG
jgi:hypothetical protein